MFCVSDAFAGVEFDINMNRMPMMCTVMGRLEQLKGLKMDLSKFIIIVPVEGEFLYGINLLEGFLCLGGFVHVCFETL